MSIPMIEHYSWYDAFVAYNLEHNRSIVNGIVPQKDYDMDFYYWMGDTNETQHTIYEFMMDFRFDYTTGSFLSSRFQVSSLA